MKTKQQTFATVTAPSATGDEPSILISTISLDRDGDEIVPEGGDFTGYLKNPVVGFQHFRTDPLPIGTTVRLDVEEGRGIRASWRWLENDPLADRVKNAFDQGVLRAASVGFLPIESERIPETGGRRFTRWELNEWSLVAVPSNRESVRVLRSLDLWNPVSSRWDLPIIELVPDYTVDHDELARGVAVALRKRVSREVARALAYHSGNVSLMDAAGITRTRR